MSERFLGKDLYEHKLRYLADVAEVTIVSKREQAELWMKAMDGDQEAWHLLWLQGTRMVLKLVRKFIELGKILPGDEMDAIQEGNVAVGLALPNWTPNRGAYSTYIWTCIRNGLTDFNLEESKGGLTGMGAEHTVHDAIELRPNGQNEGRMPDRNVADWHGYAHDLDVDDLALLIDYDNTLDSLEREVLDQIYFLDRTLTEVGEDLNLSRQTVAKYRDEGLNKLRRAYNQSF